MPSSSSSTIRYIGYVRKSTEGEERQALSIESQIDRIREQFKALDIIDVVEERKSAFLPNNRPAFASIIERIRAGEAHGIAAWHPDRLSRNELDAATLTYMVRTGELRDLKFGSYHFDNSPEGIMMLQMALSHSQYFSAKLSKDVTRGMHKKAEMGWFPSGAPPGYMNTPDREKGFRTIVKDADRFPLVRKMWDLMLGGHTTPPRILEIANNTWGYRTPRKRRSGGFPLSRSNIYKMFTNPFYYGTYEYPVGSGKWYGGKHPPMVTRDEFDRVQMILGRKGKPAPQKKEFAFTGLLRCGECGCGVTAEEKRQVICSQCKRKFSCISRQVCPRCDTPIEEMKNATFLRYVYYHCTKRKPGVRCAQGSITVSDIEARVAEALSRIQISQKYLDWALKYLKEAHERESASRETVVESQQKAYRLACRKLDALLEMRMRDEISEEEYRTKKAELAKEKASYEQLLNDTGERQDKWLALSERTFEFARHASFWFANGDVKRKREILATLGSNLVLKDGKLSIQAAEPFSLIEDRLKTVPEARATFEPAEKRMDERQTAPSCAVNPQWSARKDSNLQLTD